MSPTAAAAARLFQDAKEQLLRKQERAKAKQFSHSPKLISRPSQHTKLSRENSKADVADRLYRLAKKREHEAKHKQMVQEKLKVIDKESGRKLFSPRINKRSKELIRKKKSNDWHDDLTVEDRLYTTGIKYNKKKEDQRRREEQLATAKMASKRISLNSEILADRRSKQVEGNRSVDSARNGKQKNRKRGFQQPIGKIRQSTLDGIVQPTFQPNTKTVSTKNRGGLGEVSTMGLSHRKGVAPAISTKPMISKREREKYLREKNKHGPSKAWSKEDYDANSDNNRITIDNLVKNRIFRNNDYPRSKQDKNNEKQDSADAQVKKSRKHGGNVMQTTLRNKLFGASYYGTPSTSARTTGPTSDSADEHGIRNPRESQDQPAMSYVERLNMINRKFNLSYVNEASDSEHQDENFDAAFNTSGKSVESTEMAMYTNLPETRAHNDWEEYVSSAGYVYYYNKAKNITQWEKPAIYDIS